MEILTFTPSQARRFWSKVNKGAKCWIWTKELDREGYGRFVHRGRRIGAHRVALALATGRQEPSLFVLHSCDNPPCVNPAHLRYGTHEENMADMISRDRGAPYSLLMRGEGNVHAKLTGDEVLAIRLELAAGSTSKSLARRYGVSAPTISDIKRRTTWVHLEPASEAVS